MAHDAEVTSQGAKGRSVPATSWHGNVARIAGLNVGAVTQTPTGFRYEVTLNSTTLAVAERVRLRDARLQVDLRWRRLLLQPIGQDGPERAFVEQVRFLAQVEDGSAIAITADRIINALAEKHGICVRHIATGYIAWRLSLNGRARDFRWTVVKELNVLDLFASVERAIHDLSQN